MNKRSLGVHQVKFVIESSPRFGYGRRIAQHAQRSLHFGQIPAGHHRRRLIIQAHLEPRRAPVDKLYRPLCLYGRYGGAHIFAHHIASVQHATRHVFAVARVTFDHLIGGLKGRVGYLSDGHLFVKGLVCRYDGRIGDEWEVNARIGHKICLKLG